jgi:hypothetical protein
MNELFQLKEKVEEKTRLEEQLKKTLFEYKETKRKLEGLSKQLNQESEDVRKLEEGGIVSLFSAILGNKENKLNRERQEYLACKLKHDNCLNELEKWEIEIQRIKTRMEELGEPGKQYANFLKVKSEQLKLKNDNKFLSFEKELEFQLRQKQELNEAIFAGETALKGLRYAIQELRKAKNWGIYDMIGGGLIATAVKHSKIDEAKHLVQNVQVWLKIFKRELSDIKAITNNELTVQLNSFTTFADYFFDNLIFDWVVQEKINRSLEACEEVNGKVLKLVTKLRIADVDTTEDYNQTRVNFNSYIEKALI